MSETFPLPERCDVLVVGAGPAGSACAQWLARAGFDVALVDQHDFPRDKTCGDGLIPDAHAALVRLGVHDQVMRHGGSISAEHGIGQLKREENRRYKAPVELALMRSIKSAIDPLGIMNPGKVI